MQINWEKNAKIVLSDGIRHNSKKRAKGMTSPTNRQNRKAPQVTAQYGGYNPPAKNEHSVEPTRGRDDRNMIPD